MMRLALSRILSYSLISTRKSSSSATKPLIHGSFTSLVDRYDAFILDQFGVLHNGVEALPGAIECVKYLAEKSKTMIILSNTSAPAKKALERLPKLGFPRVFVNAVTSGEEASKYVKSEFGSTGRTMKALFLTWDIDKENNPRLTAPPQSFLDQCGDVEVAASLDEADFVLLHGSEVWYRVTGESTYELDQLNFAETGSFEVLDQILQTCVERDLKLVCANPDIVVQTPEGGMAFMPGKIAARYVELGGQIKMFGKPDEEHFHACLRDLGLSADRVAHVGDSLHHDVAGANAAGVDSIFVTSGIHKDDLQISFGELPEEDVLSELLASSGIHPTHVVSTFQAEDIN